LQPGAQRRRNSPACGFIFVTASPRLIEHAKSIVATAIMRTDDSRACTKNHHVIEALTDTRGAHAGVCCVAIVVVFASHHQPAVVALYSWFFKARLDVQRLGVAAAVGVSLLGAAVVVAINKTVCREISGTIYPMDRVRSPQRSYGELRDMQPIPGVGVDCPLLGARVGAAVGIATGQLK